MLKPDFITREDLYEAVWSQSVQSLAKGMGISDVGLAKICKKLNVPRPPRGYWAKTRAARKLLKKPLPPLQPGQDEDYRCSFEVQEGALACTREALLRLADEGVPLPTADSKFDAGDHPLLSGYRELFTRADQNIREVMTKRTCPAILVSPPLVDRAFNILQRIFEAFEKQGYQPEIRPPDSEKWQGGYNQPIPSRTGVSIRGVFVAFELKEMFTRVKVPPPLPPAPRRGRPRVPPEPEPEPVYETVSSLMLEIIGPYATGMHKRWKDTKTQKLEDALDGFFRSVMALAEVKHKEEEDKERKRQEEEAARKKAQEKATRRAQAAARRYDLESRILDVQKAQAIRNFVLAVRADAQARGASSEAGTSLGEWLAWAGDYADRLERSAVQDFAHRRVRLRKTSSSASSGYDQIHTNEAGLYQQIDLWRRRAIFGHR